MTNVVLNLGVAYEALQKLAVAFQAYDASLRANMENVRLNPTAKIVLPEKYATYENYIAILSSMRGVPL